MDDENIEYNGYGDNEDDLGDQILELCKLAQGNVTTIYWCKQQIRKRLKILDRLVKRLSRAKNNEETEKSAHIENIIKQQTAACKELGEKIQLEIESLDAIRIAAKSYGIDIKSRLLALDDTLGDEEGFDDFFDDKEDNSGDNQDPPDKTDKTP
jgi:hypothetical protein